MDEMRYVVGAGGDLSKSCGMPAAAVMACFDFLDVEHLLSWQDAEEAEQLASLLAAVMKRVYCLKSPFR